MPAERLSAMLADLLEHGEAWAPGLNRYLISPSIPAADCALLAVWLGGVHATAPSKNSCQIVSKADLHLSVFLCTPTQEGKRPPNADLVTAASTELSNIGEAIWFGLLEEWKEGTLFSDAKVGCTEIDLTQGMAAINAAGGIAGWDFLITVQL